MSSSAPRAPQQRFLNCEMEFECPQNWFELTQTEQAGVKHCSACQKNVYLCITQEELDVFSLKSDCIAFFSDPDLPTRFKLSREKAEANRNDTEMRIDRVTLGLPRSANLGSLKGFLEEFNEDVKKNSEER